MSKLIPVRGAPVRLVQSVDPLSTCELHHVNIVVVFAVLLCVSCSVLQLN